MEAPFDPEVCRDWWRRKCAMGVQHPPTWPEMAQAWFDRDLERKRLRARIFTRQIAKAKFLRSKIVPIAHARNFLKR
jgi:hypothetical protein